MSEAPAVRAPMIPAAVRAAYAGWSQIFSMVFSAISVFALLSRVLSLRLSEIAAFLVEEFRAVFHPIVKALLGWVAPLSTPQLDVLVIWLAIGSAVSRTFFIEVAEEVKVQRKKALGKPDWMAVARLAALALVMPVIWPVGLVLIWRKPHLKHKASRGGGRSLMRSTDKKAGRFKYTQVRYICDLRVSLGIQLLTVALAVAGLVITNQTLAG